MIPEGDCEKSVIKKTLGRYKVVGELGRGAMGAVYRAVDPLIEREVAIKTLLPNLPDDVMNEVRERFIREARSAGRLNHPNIVTIFDVGEHEGVAYIAMELLEGRSLQQVLRDQTRLTFQVIAELAAQVADALDEAQQFKIVHRDVKPANIMVAPSGRAKLTDFGVAHLDSSSMTQTGAALGSPKYMSPEQVLGLPLDPRSDIFSLGVVLYEMLTRRTPFERPNDTTVFPMMHRIAGEPHIPLRQVDPSIPQAFEHILVRALAKKPESRYRRGAEMAADLRNFKTLDPRKMAAMPAPGAAPRPGSPDFDKTTINPAATSLRPPSPEEQKARAQLLGEMDSFTRNFEQEEQARIRAEQEAAARKAAELHSWGMTEEHKREQFDRQRDTSGGLSADTSQSLVRRTGALDALKRQSVAQAPKDDKSAARAKAVAALDEGLRAAHQYLVQFVRELNTVNPVSGRPYEFVYLGKLPSVKLSNATINDLANYVDGRSVFEQLALRFRVTPVAPAAASVSGEDILRCKQYLQTLQTEFKAQAEARNKAGMITRALFTVSGSLPCEINLRGDYTSMAVLIELVNVRRTGRVQARVPGALIGDVVDDLARYAIGVDDDFEKVLKPGR
jgi:serine/threonine protein kinase